MLTSCKTSSMRNTRFFSLVCGLLMIFAISCDNAGSGTEADTNGSDSTAIISDEKPDKVTGSMNAEVAGGNWMADNVSAKYESDLLVITGTGTDGSVIRLEIGETPDIGIFPIRRGKLQNASYTKASGANAKYHCPFNNTSGVINIELINDDELVGTFSFAGSNFSERINIEEGRFSVPITNSKPTL